MPELVPYPFAGLIRRMFRELDERQSIFDLPARKFFTGSPRHDFSVAFHGRRVATPLGPAAGPHSQMAQNLVLAWLGGSRVFELKTVQIKDELRIPRPCIDIRTIGYNVEWSQELKLEQSLEEYVKGVMLIEMLVAGGKLPLVPRFERMALDMSVGYDLEGIRQPRLQAFIRGLMDAGPVIERLRAEIPAEFAAFKDLDFPTRLCDTVTLSTFHGCPSGEIAAIIEHLMEEHRLHSVVKFNPMLLGPVETRRLFHEALGYRHVTVPETAFTRDTTWDQAVEIMERLAGRAGALGLGLGAKFSNTLIVLNDQGFLAEGEKEAYLSGPPLHVLAMHLVRRFRRTFGDRFPISFSAGIDRHNFADAAALGLVPVTVCTDLLKPGGYGRLPSYHNELALRMDQVGARDLDEYALLAYGQAGAALADLGDPARGELAALARELPGDGGGPPVAPEKPPDLRAAAGRYFESWVSAARLRNTEHYVERATADGRYALARNNRPPRRIGRHLQLFDCISCDKCVPVCPNAANFIFRPDVREVPVVRLRRAAAGWSWEVQGTLALTEEHQIGTFADFCNECGNCDVFCPEEGGPYRIKPLFFGSEAGWRASAQSGFFLERHAGGDRVLARAESAEFELLRRDEWFDFRGNGFSVRFCGDDPPGSLVAEGPDEIDLTWCHLLEIIRRGILAGGEINHVSIR